MTRVGIARLQGGPPPNKPPQAPLIVGVLYSLGSNQSISIGISVSGRKGK